MTKKKLEKGISLAKGFDLDGWMHKNYAFGGNKEDAITLLLEKGRYKNLLNDTEFIQAREGDSKKLSKK